MMNWLAKPLLRHSMWLVALSHSLVAMAHTSPGYVQCSLAEDAITLRLTMNLTTLSDLSPIDRNQDGELAPEEIDDALPLIRDHLKALVKMQRDEHETAMGELSEVRALWPSNRPIREREGLAPDACFIDLVFKSHAQDALESVGIEFGALLAKCQNLQDLECSLTNGSTEQTKQKADRTSSLVRWKIDSRPTRHPPAKSVVAADSSSSKHGGPVKLTVASFLALACCWFWVLQKRKAAKSQLSPKA